MFRFVSTQILIAHPALWRTDLKWNFQGNKIRWRPCPWFRQVIWRFPIALSHNVRTSRRFVFIKKSYFELSELIAQHFNAKRFLLALEIEFLFGFTLKEQSQVPINGIFSEKARHKNSVHFEVSSISFPESSFPLTSGRKTRAKRTTISGMRHRCRLCSITRWEEFGYFLCFFQSGCSLVFLPLVKGNEDSGNKIDVSFDDK